MARWLMKSEPGTYSWADLVRERATQWDGVRNAAARLHLKAMTPGDQAFFYHSGDERAVVGIMEVAALAHPDPKDDTGVWRCVDMRAVEDLPRPVTLVEIKANPKLADMALVKYARLSVQPVTAAEWAEVCRMGGLTTPLKPAKKSKG